MVQFFGRKANRAVATGFHNSYVNSDCKRLAADELRARLPGTFVTTGIKLSPERRGLDRRLAMAVLKDRRGNTVGRAGRNRARPVRPLSGRVSQRGTDWP